MSPVAHIGGELVLAHMAQHVLMADLAALLLVLGLTRPSPAGARDAPRPPVRVLAHPVVAFGLWAVDLYVWHLPVLYQAALCSEAVHALQHGSFVLFGFTMCLRCWGRCPAEWFGNEADCSTSSASATGAILGNVFLWSERVFYPLPAGPGELGLEPLQDQGGQGRYDGREQHRHSLLLGLAVREDRARVGEKQLLELATSGWS